MFEANDLVAALNPDSVMLNENFNQRLERFKKRCEYIIQNIEVNNINPIQFIETNHINKYYLRLIKLVENSKTAAEMYSSLGNPEEFHDKIIKYEAIADTALRQLNKCLFD